MHFYPCCSSLHPRWLFLALRGPKWGFQESSSLKCYLKCLALKLLPTFQRSPPKATFQGKRLWFRKRGTLLKIPRPTSSNLLPSLAAVRLMDGLSVVGSLDIAMLTPKHQSQNTWEALILKPPTSIQSDKPRSRGPELPRPQHPVFRHHLCRPPS